MSIAGGYYKAVERAAALGMSSLQIFTKNNNQWRAKEITPDEAEWFRAALAGTGITHPIAHDSYLINLASPDEELWKKSVDALIVEFQRAALLGLKYVVAHPGSFTTSSEEAGIRRVIRGLDQVHRQTPELNVACLLETTAGQGSNLGWRFEHLAAMLDGVQHPERLGICFDTCHVFAAGYPMSPEKEYRATMRAFDKSVGLAQIKAFHLNDSKAAFGSRVDRHAHIGRGEMGLAPFRRLLAARRFRHVPMYLETPKGTTEDGEPWDAVNLRTLRELMRRKKR